MKRTVNYAILYAILAMIGGVFYREYTKFMGFDGRTTLAFVHTHLFLLGMVMFLIVTFAIHQFHIEKQKHYRLFLILYHPGVLLTSLMLFLRGITQVNGNELTNTVNAMISGVSGIGHILTGIGLLLFLFILKASVKDA